MYATPYRELDQVLRGLVSGIAEVLGDRLVGAYLQGSFAVGDFDEHSDVDWVVAIDGELSTDEVRALQGMHGQLYDSGPEWAKHLEGSYFPTEILRRIDRRGQDLWYLDNGARSLIRSDHCNTILVRWVVRESGVVLAGPPPQTLVEAIPRRALRAEILETMLGWGQQILDDPSRYENRFYQGYIVLNYSRMLHDLVRGFPGSKREGAAWATVNLDPAWSDLIDAAWDCRPDPARQIREPADPAAYARTLRFLADVMDAARCVALDLDREGD